MRAAMQIAEAMQSAIAKAERQQVNGGQPDQMHSDGPRWPPVNLANNSFDGRKFRAMRKKVGGLMDFLVKFRFLAQLWVMTLFLHCTDEAQTGQIRS